MLRFVDDAHAAAADLAQQSIVAQPAQVAAVGRRLDKTPCVAGQAGVLVGRGLEPLDQLQGREEIEDFRGVLGVAGGVFSRGGALAAPATAQVLLGEFVHWIELRWGNVAVHDSWVGGCVP